MKAFLILALAPFSCGALSAPVYKCKNEKGETVFTDKKCEFEQKQERVWDSSRGDTSYPVTMSGADPAELGSSSGQTTFTEQRIESKSDGRGGYICSTPSRSWVQTAPCPYVAREPHTTVVTHWDGTQTRVDSTYGSAVGEQQLTHDQLCAKLASNSKDNESTYYRNKIKRESCP